MLNSHLDNPKFKIGDKVTITTPFYNLEKKRGEITSVGDGIYGNIIYDVRTDDRDYLMIYENELEIDFQYKRDELIESLFINNEKSERNLIG